MWMMGYNEGGHGDFNIPDSFNSRKLRPVIPRQLPSAKNTSTSITSTASPCSNHIHGSRDFFTQYYHLAAMAEQSKVSEFTNTPQVVVSSRWNPTPEQLRALEELYRRGTRTPSAEKIQYITAQLRKFGKIEGKNVFYWFQNHKARERQKRRRQMESCVPSADHDQPVQISMTSTDHQKKELLGASKTVFEVEQTKNWAPSTNHSTSLAEESVSIHRTAKAAVAVECRTDGRIQFDEQELQQRKNFVERNATWQTMQLSCPPHPHPHRPTHLINAPATCTSTTATTGTTTTTKATVRTMDERFIKTHNLSIFVQPYTSDNGLHNHSNHNNNNTFMSCNIQEQDHGWEESQTLQLFPLRSSDHGNGHFESTNNKDTELSAMSVMNAHPYPFFEFIPLKN